MQNGARSGAARLGAVLAAAHARLEVYSRAEERAVGLFRTTVENEQNKNRLGAATLFDVTYTEGGPTVEPVGLVTRP